MYSRQTGAGFSLNSGLINGYEPEKVPLTGDKPKDDRRLRAAKRTFGQRIFGTKFSPGIALSFVYSPLQVRLGNNTSMAAGARVILIASGNPALTIGPSVRLTVNSQNNDFRPNSVAFRPELRSAPLNLPTLNMQPRAAANNIGRHFKIGGLQADNYFDLARSNRAAASSNSRFSTP